MAKTTARIRKNTDTPAATDDQLAATTDQCIPAVITAMTADSAPAEVVAAVVEAVVAAQVTDPLADVVASVTESATTAGASDALVASVTTALTEAHTEATEPEVAPEEVAKRGKLAKSAADSLLALQNVATELAFLAESEGMNGDSDAATRVRAILATVNDAIAAEAAQVGTPEDVAVRAEEIAIDAALNPVTEPVIVVADQMVPVPVVYSAIIGDLAKQGTGLAKGSGKAGVDNSTIQRVHDMTHMAGATCAPTAASLAKVGGAADTSVEDITASVTAALEPLAKASDVATMKAELLGTLGTLREGLAEIGKRAAPGGPAKYGTVRQAMDKASDAAGDEPGARAAWLDAEAAAATDPNIKAYLSKASAQAKTASLLGSR